MHLSHWIYYHCVFELLFTTAGPHHPLQCYNPQKRVLEEDNLVRTFLERDAGSSTGDPQFSSAKKGIELSIFF